MGLQPGYIGLQLHDRNVIALQLAGCKHWRVYRTPLPLPYAHEQLGKDPTSPLTNEMLGDPILEARARPPRTRRPHPRHASHLPPPASCLLPLASCQLRLQPGELLYLPRGAPHEARADQGASSLHITLTAARRRNMAATAVAAVAAVARWRGGAVAGLTYASLRGPPLLAVCVPV